MGLWLGPVYTAAAVVLGAVFLGLAVVGSGESRRGGTQAILFHYSLLYLALLFVAAALDPVLL